MLHRRGNQTLVVELTSTYERIKVRIKKLTLVNNNLEMVPEELEVEEVKQNNEKKSDKQKVSFIIESFLHRTLDIEECAKHFIHSAYKSNKDKYHHLLEEISANQKTLENEVDKNVRLLTTKSLSKNLREIERESKSNLPETLEKSLFNNLFANFDKYIGDLVTVLYENCPNLYKNLNREVKLSTVLTYESLDDLREEILNDEIETLRRKSYVEQFKDLQNKFSITLTKFEDWPLFVESAQRRNLFTHCDGIVSKQYLDICSEVGYKHKNEVGDQLKIGAKYFFQSSMVISEVAVMLAQTLWRKTLPDQIEEADNHLSSLIFDYLHMEQWGKAICLSKFALNLPNISSETNERLFRVNYAIALNAIGQDKAAKNVLDKKDWSATTYDFKLAYAVVTKNYEEAMKFMIKIGLEGEYITELSYHDWPLFRDFRDREEFLSGYEKVYGYKYSSKLSEIAEDKKANVDEILTSSIDDESS